MNEQAMYQHYEESIQELDERQQPAATGKPLKHPRKERRDKGIKLIKARDLVVLLWIAQQFQQSRLAWKVLFRVPRICSTALKIAEAIEIGQRLLVVHNN